MFNNLINKVTINISPPPLAKETDLKSTNAFIQIS